MNETVLLVDYENLGSIDLSEVPTGVRVQFFFGASQKSVKKEFLQGAVKLGDRFQLIDIGGHGKNAVDFHIAFYLGELLARSPKPVFIVLSKDKGFDPLVVHLKARGFRVRRAPTLSEAFPPPQSSVSLASPPRRQSADPLAATTQWLKSMPENTRPRKRNGLIAHLFSRHGKKISEDKIESLVDTLMTQGKLSEANGVLAYNI